LRVIIVNEEGQAVPCAHVTLKNSLFGIVSNPQGYLELNLIDSHWNDTLLISHLSFQDKFFPLWQHQADTSLKVIQLSNSNYQLSEIYVEATPSLAIDILLSALDKLLENYHKDPAVLKAYFTYKHENNTELDPENYNRSAEAVLYFTDVPVDRRKAFWYKSQEEVALEYLSKKSSYTLPIDNWVGTNQIRDIFKLNLYKYNLNYGDRKYLIKTRLDLKQFGDSIYQISLYKDGASHPHAVFNILKENYQILKVISRYDELTYPEILTKKKRSHIYMDYTLEFQLINKEVFIKYFTFVQDYSFSNKKSSGLSYSVTDSVQLFVTEINREQEQLPDPDIQINMSKSLFSNSDTKGVDFDKLNKYIRYAPASIIPDSLKEAIRSFKQIQQSSDYSD